MTATLPAAQAASRGFAQFTSAKVQISALGKGTGLFPSARISPTLLSEIQSNAYVSMQIANRDVHAATAAGLRVIDANYDANYGCHRGRVGRQVGDSAACQSSIPD